MSKSLRTQSNFGKEIKKRLIDLDMDAKDLAYALDYSPSYINEVLRGTRNSEAIKLKICEALGLDYKLLMEELNKGA